MARCLRCKAGNEWIEGDVKPEPSEPSHALLKGEPSDLVKRIRAYSYVDAQAVEDLQDDVLRLHREKMDLLYGPDGFPRSNALPNTVPNTDVALRAAVHLLKRVIGPSFFDNSLQGQIESFLRGQGESFTTGLPSAPSTTARKPGDEEYIADLEFSVRQCADLLRAVHWNVVADFGTSGDGLQKAEKVLRDVEYFVNHGIDAARSATRRTGPLGMRVCEPSCHSAAACLNPDNCKADMTWEKGRCPANQELDAKRYAARRRTIFETRLRLQVGGPRPSWDEFVKEYDEACDKEATLRRPDGGVKT